MHENGPTIRCPECNHKGNHAAFCRAGIDESRPMTSAERYGGFTVGETYGRADADIAPAWPRSHPAQAIEASLPTSALARKELPLASGLLDYFPAALIAVAGLSRIGNEQHNPGQPMHWARAKSGDEADALLRHLVDRGTIDTDGLRHSTKVAWRALALLQKELEEAGLAPLSRGSM
jgi:hypothetical protein